MSQFWFHIKIFLVTVTRLLDFVICLSCIRYIYPEDIYFKSETWHRKGPNAFYLFSYLRFTYVERIPSTIMLTMLFLWKNTLYFIVVTTPQNAINYFHSLFIFLLRWFPICSFMPLVITLPHYRGKKNQMMHPCRFSLVNTDYVKITEKEK